MLREVVRGGACALWLGLAACGGGAEPQADAGVSCASDADCDDGLWCTGDERCIPDALDADARGCVAGATRCAETSCDESTQTCSLCATPDVDGDGVDSIACGGTDCDDTDANRYPGNPETCTNPLTGEVDPATAVHDEDCDASTLGDDADEDGFYRSGCANRQPDGVPFFGVDCDDRNALRRPGFAEICDGLDNDCQNGLDFPGEDDDSDGYADCADLVDQPIYDCDDGNPAIHPGVAIDECNFVDDDCDGEIEDADEDGYISVDAMCVGGEALRLDCDDSILTGETASPDLPELCNGVDDDCSGEVDDGDARVTSCGALAWGGTPTCEGALGCGTSCRDGHGSCDADPASGCETSTRSSTTHCGACGGECPLGCLDGACDTPIQLVAGHGHACALTEAGRVLCWGWDMEGQLGNGPLGSTSEHRPLAVDGLAATPAALAAGDRHTCARLDDGRVQCWGQDLGGQLGDGPDGGEAEPAPVLVQGLTEDVVAIGAGSSHTCAALVSGGVACWGLDDAGQLGDGDDGGAQEDAAVAVAGLTDRVVQLSAGVSHTCARTESGGVFCWGDDGDGQLGDGDDGGSAEPAPVAVLGLSSGVAAIAAGSFHTCAITTSGSALCWGRDHVGQLGDGADDGAAEPAPVSVQGLDGEVAEVHAGDNFTCARDDAGLVRCWGTDSFGQLGDGADGGASHDTAAPAVALGVAVSTFVTGKSFVCAALEDDAIRCWGQGTLGQLGEGDAGGVSRSSPVALDGRALVDITVGDTHSCALEDDGDVVCWGSDDAGQLGDGADDGASALLPVDVVGLPGPAIHVRAGRDHTCALLTDGDVACWGSDAFGQLGSGDGVGGERVSPSLVAGLPERVVAVSSGLRFSCALLRSGRVYCWGEDDRGQLGNGVDDGLPSDVPSEVIGLGGVATELATGSGHACALLESGTVRCWGSDSVGQLGDGDDGGASESVPVDVVGLEEAAIAIGAGGGTTCAVLETGGVRCWGADNTGQNGDGDDAGAPALVPVAVQSIGGAARAVDVGDRHACALLADGSVTCWGGDFDGQLGDGDDDGAIAHIGQGVALPAPAHALALAHRTVCVLTTGGRALCWGRNTVGEAGHGGAAGADVLSPRRVFGR